MPDKIARCEASREDRSDDEDAFHNGCPQPFWAAEINPLLMALPSRSAPILIPSGKTPALEVWGLV
jgi:hypothetical protein